MVWIDIYNSSYAVYCSAGNINKPSMRGERLLQHIVDNEVPLLARSTFYESLLIGQETSQKCPL